MRTLTRIALCAALSLCTVGSVFPQSIAPEHIDWVEVIMTPDSSLAETVRQNLIDEGYAPVHVVSESGTHSVRVGEFAIYADAHLLQQDIRVGHPGARILSATLAEERAEGREWTFPALIAPVGPHTIFNLHERPLESEQALGFDNAASPILAGGQLADPTSAEEVLATEEDAIVLAELIEDNTDEALGLAYRVIADTRTSLGELEHALDIAMVVANESVAATPQQRYEAMWLVARLHHAMGARMTAYRAYCELEAAINDDRDLARCLVEQAGLLIELVLHHDTGRHADARLLCDLILTQFAGATDQEVRHRMATADLMQAETWHYESQFDRCATECHRVAEEWIEFRRERAMALMFAGLSERSLGRLPEARRTLEEIVAMDLTADDNFPNLAIQRNAHSWLANVCAEMGDREASERHTRLAVMIPNSRSENSRRWGQGPAPARPTPPR